MLGVGSLVEVALITMQRWRAVPSHFNRATAFDEAVFSAMGMSVMLVALATAATLVWALVGLRSDPVVRWAAVTGLALILAGSRIGVEMIVQGEAFVAATGGSRRRSSSGRPAARSWPMRSACTASRCSARWRWC